MNSTSRASCLTIVTLTVSSALSACFRLSRAQMALHHGRQEYEVQELLKFKICWGLPYVLVLWTGPTRRATPGSRWTTLPT